MSRFDVKFGFDVFAEIERLHSLRAFMRFNRMMLFSDLGGGGGCGGGARAFLAVPPEASLLRFALGLASSDLTWLLFCGKTKWQNCNRTPDKTDYVSYFLSLSLAGFGRCV